MRSPSPWSSQNAAVPSVLHVLATPRGAKKMRATSGRVSPRAAEHTLPLGAVPAFHPPVSTAHASTSSALGVAGCSHGVLELAAGCCPPPRSTIGTRAGGLRTTSATSTPRLNRSGSGSPATGSSTDKESCRWDTRLRRITLEPADRRSLKLGGVVLGGLAGLACWPTAPPRPAAASKRADEPRADVHSGAGWGAEHPEGSSSFRSMRSSCSTSVQTAPNRLPTSRTRSRTFLPMYPPAGTGCCTGMRLT